MRTITLEEHFATADFLKATGGDSNPALAAVRDRLLDIGAGRIAAMDEAGIDMQVLSLAAIGVDELSAATAEALMPDINDELAAAVRDHPDRFAGFALLPLKSPARAAAELERCVKELGFPGALLNGTTDGKFLDAPEFTPIWEAAADLGVPVYVHPAPPPPAVQQAYYSGLPDPFGFMLSIAGWGWHAETGLHTLRLITSGLFDRLPNLQVIVGHMGEGVPYALARSSSVLSRPAKLGQTVADYFKTNLHITTSGYFTLPPFQCARQVLGLDRIMVSIDYPFSPNTDGRTFLTEAAGILTEAELHALTHTNAERLLRLPTASRPAIRSAQGRL